jgi:hypothetical protein
MPLAKSILYAAPALAHTNNFLPLESVEIDTMLPLICGSMVRSILPVLAFHRRMVRAVAVAIME